MMSLIYNDIQFLEIGLAELSKIIGDEGGMPGSKQVYVNGKNLREPKGDKIYAGWPASNRKNLLLPDLLIVPTQLKGEFFAWSLSFIPQIAPLTSMVRVLDWQDWIELISKSDQDTSSEFAPIAALIFGETASDSINSETLARVNVAVFDSSCSAVLAQAFAQGGSWTFMVETADRWNDVRSLVGMPKRSLPLSEVVRIWLIVTLRYRKGSPSQPLPSEDDLLIWEICHSLRRSGSMPAFLLRRLIGLQVEQSEFIDEPRGDIESRILRIERFARFLMGLKIDPFIGAFLLGSSASLIAPGQTRHLDYVRRWRDAFPCVVMWYTLCASLHPKTTILTERGYLCWRLGKKALECPVSLDGPICDVAIDELRVMKKNEGAQFPIRLLSGGIMRVEIFPSIIATVRSGSVEDRQQELFARQETERSKEIINPELQAEALNSIDSLRHELDRLQKMISSNDRRNRRRR
jgi:hypothetical protein